MERDRTTVVTCPEHSGCTVAIATAKKQHLEDRVPLSLPYAYNPWLQRIGEVVVSVTHYTTEQHPDALLVGDLVVAPKDIGDRMSNAERRIKALRQDLANAESREVTDAANLTASLAKAAERQRVYTEENARRIDSDRHHDLLLQTKVWTELADRIAVLEEFSKRNRSGRRWWSKRG